jgi:Fur family iron response transcriptional regulator
VEDDGDEGDCQRLVGAGMRPTRQRLSVMKAIRQGGRRHLVAESFHQELADCGLRLSLATVYNTLNHFAAAGLLRRVGFGDRTWYCTNTSEHHHFFDMGTGRLEDIPGEQPRVVGLPEPPPGMSIRGVEIIIRIQRE